MISSAEELRALRTVARLEPSVSLLEQRLADLAASLGQRDAEAIDEAAANLQRALASSISEFQRAAREGGGIPPQLRQRLILAGGQVATLREAVAQMPAPQRAVQRPSLRAVATVDVHHGAGHVAQTQFVDKDLDAFVLKHDVIALGGLIAWVAVTWIMEIDFVFSVNAVLETLAVAALMITAFGGIGTWAVLRAPPVPYLRTE